MPKENRRGDGFSATNQVKTRQNKTKPPNALPASERCPGQLNARDESIFTLPALFVCGHGGDILWLRRWSPPLAFTLLVAMESVP